MIHCVSHRLELAIKDAYTDHEEFSILGGLFTQIRTIFRKMNKLMRLLHDKAEFLGIKAIKRIRVDGTRWQNHKIRAIRAL